MSSSNINNGLITKIWGPALWTGLHCITFGYPINPTDEQKENYKQFFVSLGDVLPCKYCRISYKEYLEEDDTKLNEKALKDRESLTKWLYKLHNKVNNKLGIDYGVDFDCIKKKYESYRAKCPEKKDKNVKGCIMPLDKKKICYKEANKKDCPIIDYKTGKIFKILADIRKISKKNYYFWNIIRKNKGKIIKDDNWDNRNRYCDKIIKYMRENGIESIEKKGKYKGLPTKLELRLMLCLSTNLSKNEIIKMKNHLISRYNIKI